MALRAKKPEMVEKRLKALFYGMAGVGKTTAAIQFPKPYLIDTEKGSENNQYIKRLESSGGVVFSTCDFDEVLTEIRSLLSEKHEYKTLIIDPLTLVYNDLLEKSALSLKKQSRDKDATGTEFGRHYSEADKKMKHLINLLLRLDMNVIITAHAKKEYGDNFVVLGQTFDCYKKIDYLFDLVFEIQKRGKERVGIVKKSRIESFPDGETFPFCYDQIAEKYGRVILEKESVAEVLATKDQINEFTSLIKVLKVADESIEKWKSKEEVENFEEMKSATIDKYIAFLRKELEGVTKNV